MENGIPESDQKKPPSSNSSLNADIDRIYDKKLLPLLLLLFFNATDIHLNILVINLIFKCFTQRSRLIQSLKKVQILFEEKDQLLFEHIASKVLQLKFMCEQSEVWLHTSIIKISYLMNYNYKFAIYRVIDILKELIDLLYGSIEMENQNIYLNENKFDLSDLDPMRQIMMRNLNVHEIILKLLRDGSYVFEDLIERTSENKLVIQVFELCYDFLLKFCLNDNKENKKLLHKEINLFIAHLDFFEVGQTALVNEIYHNNYKISVNVTINYLSAYMSKISNKNGKGGHNPIYLDFFDRIMYEKNQPIKENCLKLITFIFDSNKKYEFLFMKENPYYILDPSEEEHSSFKKRFGHYIFNLELKEMDTDDIPYLYHAKVLNILYNLIMTSSDKQLFKLILQKTLNLNYLFYLLTLDDIYLKKGPKEYLLTILQTPLLKLLNEIWLTSEKPPSSIFNNAFVLRFINKHIILLKNLTKSDIEKVLITRRTSFSRYFSKEISVRKQQSQEVFVEKAEDQSLYSLEYDEGEEALLNEIITKHCTDHNFDYIDTLINEVIPVILSLNTLLVLNEKNLEDLNQREDLKALNEFSEAFINFFKKNITNADIFKRKGNLKILQEFQRTFNLNNLDLPHERDDPNEKFEDLEKEIEDEIELPLKNILSNRKWSKNPHRNNVWKVFILNVLISNPIKELIIQEKEALLEAIIHIEDLKYPDTFKSKMKKPITLEGFIKKLVNFIKHGDGKEEGINAMVVNQVMVLLKDILDYCKEINQKVKMQNIMNKCNLIKTILYFMCDKNINKLVYKNIINLCNSLLEGGNLECQNAFFDYFINTNNSEIVFAGIFDAINKHMAFNVQKNSLHEIMDYFMKDVVYCYKSNNAFSLNNILRLLQSLTENHNVNLQVFFLVFLREIIGFLFRII